MTEPANPHVLAFAFASPASSAWKAALKARLEMLKAGQQIYGGTPRSASADEDAD